MNPDPTVVDVLVIGGGPAGSVAAGLLARKGHRVTLVNRPVPRHALAESLPPSCLRLFDRIGLSSAIDEAAFLRSRGNTVWWGDGETRHELFPGEETGLQVHRHEFDKLLLSLAEQIGVSIVHDAVVQSVSLGGTDTARVAYKVKGATLTQHARWVLDCSGRAGVVARQVRVVERGRETVALVGVWKRPYGWPIGDETRTLVESYADGWSWSVPTRKHVRFVTVMVDKSQTSLARGGELDEMYYTEIAKTSRMRDMMRDAELVEPLWACGASPYGAVEYVIGNCLLVGDAASFIDPLSSYGVKKAMASAWVAAAAVHTALVNPDMTEASMQFFASREAQVYGRFTDLTMRQYHAVARGEPHPFWITRATGDPADIMSGSDPDIAGLRKDHEVLAAFQMIREASSIDLELAPTASRIQRPGISVDRIVMEDRLGCDWMPEGVRYLRGVDVLMVADLAARHHQVPDLYEDYNRRAVPVALPDLLGAISVMVAKGILRFREQPASRHG